MISRKMIAFAAGLLCLATLLVLSFPDKAEADCEYSYIFDYSFYSDPGKTNLVGGCQADCSQAPVCWGELTEYFTYYSEPCVYCG